jgi:hypothetical protein
LRTILILAVVAGALANAGAAAAGCLATVGLTPPPAAIEAGETWPARITVLQHGRTPLADAQPRLTIRGDAGATRTFIAAPTTEPGVYLAEAVFPSSGTWRYEVFDGFTSMDGEQVPCARTHAFGPVTIGGSASGGGGNSGGSGGVPLWPVVGGSLALAAVAAVGAAGWNRRRQHAVRPTA